jgi:hypothetical protein
MNEWLSLVIGLIAVVQAIRFGWVATAPAIIFAIGTWIYMFFLGEVGDYRHYFLGMILALFITGMLSLCHKTKLVTTLMLICVIDVCLNGIGWILYENYFDPCWHEYSFVILYLYVISALITWEGDMRRGKYNDDNWSGNFYPSPLQRCDDLFQCKKGARN